MPKPSRTRSGRHQSPATVAVEALFEETVALYHRLTADAAAIHRAGALSGPRRTVLLGLARSGPQTVAHMARSRAQSRQRFQPLVNRLIADGLVEPRPNPTHKASPLIALTVRGQQTVERIVDRERSLLGRVKISKAPAAVARAVGVLRDVRRALERQLPTLLNSSSRRRTRSGHHLDGPSDSTGE
jgi:DNA-binding MarR family transcriptional regulator